MEHWWNNTDKGYRVFKTKTCSIATPSTTNSTQTGQGLNPNIRSDKLATESLNFRKATLPEHI